MTSCARPGCSGDILDGFCDLCGLAPADTPATGSSDAVTGPVSTSRSGRSSGSRRSSRSSRASRGRLGAGLVEVPPVPYRDPSAAVMANPEVAERKRFCSSCDRPVGRGHDGRPGRTEGFCQQCGTAYSFTPKLVAGDLVGGQYEVLGCLAHGGLGWIYLACDRKVSDRWVVLKGLLNTGDSDAMAAAVAERRFLATVEHPNILKIYNFAEHPDPLTGDPVGYIVMEYVGGRSLKELRAEPGADGRPRPLPLGQALAYMLEILPALGYLHELGTLYCDFKPDNVIQTEEQLKLIDLGAVRRMDDEVSPIYKTDGYCAPELETEGVSVSSDLFTVGRTLAVLAFSFDYAGAHRYELPDAVDVPVLAEHESFHRLLRRATDPDPDLRFGSATEMAEQVTGVLREVLAAEDDRPRPALSTVFSAEREVFGGDPDSWPAPLDPVRVAAALPVPLVNPADPAASFLATTSVTDPRRLIDTLTAAPVSTVETALSLTRAKIEAGDLAGATAGLDALEQTDDADWRITWYRGLAALAGGDLPAARVCFDLVYGMLPGEAAGKLALAATEECLGNASSAARLYDRVWRTDPAYVSAAFGLARTRLRMGDRDGAVTAAESVPSTSSHHLAAQLVAIRARLAPDRLAERYLVEAGERLAALELDVERAARARIDVLNAAHAWVSSNGRGSGTVLGWQLDDRAVRRGLEQHYRTLARLARSKGGRRALVDRANSVRPVTWL